MNKFYDEKIIHSPNMRDWLIRNGGVLLKVKPDLVDPKKNIYIFLESSISDIIGKYVPKGKK